jgi:hypothetical protein
LLLLTIDIKEQIATLIQFLLHQMTALAPLEIPIMEDPPSVDNVANAIM